MIKTALTILGTFFSICLISQVQFTKCEIADQFAPRDVAYGDFNNDGLMDYVASSDNGSISIYYDVMIGYSPVEVLVTIDPGLLRAVDLNQDGNLDIVALTRDANTLMVMKNNGEAIPSFEVDGYNFGNYPAALEVEDINGDDLPDIFVAHGSQNSVVHLINEGNFEFTRNTSANIDIDFTDQIEIVDLNQDGFKDILTHDARFRTIIVFENDGSSLTFNKQIIGDSLVTGVLGVGDLDNDGLKDIVVSTLFSGLVLLNNTGEAFEKEFIDSNLVISTVLEMADLDNDGDLDIITAENALVLDYFENNNGSFNRIQISNEQFTNPIRLFDVDDDNDLDILTSSFRSYDLLIWKNDLLSAVENEVESNDFMIYPNPASDRLQIETDLYIQKVNVFDITSKKVITTSQSSIDLSGILAGVYLLEIITDTGSVYEKFIKE